jgi:hypothetical protein
MKPRKSVIQVLWTTFRLNTRELCLAASICFGVSVVTGVTAAPLYSPEKNRFFLNNRYVHKGAIRDSDVIAENLTALPRFLGSFTKLPGNSLYTNKQHP